MIFDISRIEACYTMTTHSDCELELLTVMIRPEFNSTTTLVDSQQSATRLSTFNFQTKQKVRKNEASNY